LNSRDVLPWRLGQIKQLLLRTDSGALSTKSAFIVLKRDFREAAITFENYLSFTGGDTG
jgi:hypothetical protein